MNGLARSCWLGAVIYAASGMVFGIYMAASADHSLMPAHAHLNLLGWVSIALYGTFYALVPKAALGWLPRLQVAAAHIGVLVITPGIVLALTNGTEAVAQAGSVVVLASMVLFAAVVVRSTRRETKLDALPAE